MTDLLESKAKLDELAARIRVACSHPDERPSFVHWSDAEMLVAIGREIEATSRKLAAINRALSILFGALRSFFPGEAK